jgi:predicted helicase
MKVEHQKLDKISKIHNSQKRGRAFEKFLANLFRKADFKIHENPKGAKPRRSDLMAIDDDDKYLLIEAKHQKRKIDVADIDNVRSRLRRVPGEILGAIFSVSNFTSSAIREVEADRTREILLFNQQEIDRLVAGESTLQNLIQRKKESLRISGTVWFFQRPQHTRHLLRDTTQRFQIGSKRSSSIKLQAGYTRLLFSQNIPDTR